jgi:hypothetical protein
LQLPALLAVYAVGLAGLWRRSAGVEQDEQPAALAGGATSPDP